VGGGSMGSSSEVFLVIEVSESYDKG